MAEALPTRPELYQCYRRYIDGEVAPQAARSAAIIVFALNALGLPLDYFARPDLFTWYLWFRIPIALVTVVGYFYTSRTHAHATIQAVVAVEVVTFLAYIWSDGGVTSYMATGLVILFCAIPVLVPVTAYQIAGVVGLTIAGYIGIGLTQSDPVTMAELLGHTFNPVMGGGVAIASASILDRIRFGDFLQRRDLEQARDHLQELDRAKARFTSNVHHELRTPLTLILAPLDSMRGGEMGSLDPAIRRALDMMYANGQRLYKMINNLLDLSKVESGQLEIKRVPLDLDPLANRIVMTGQSLAERKGVDLRIEGVSLLPEICADPDALEKVLVNLMGNALKFTEEGDAITVRGESLDDGVRITVEDTGVGIPTDKLSTVFDRFAQVDNSATRKHEGTGIGLSLTQELVQLHGGRIWAESEGEGCGTRMVVELPFGEVDETPDQEVLRTSSGQALNVSNSLAAVESDLGLEDSPEIEGDIHHAGGGHRTFGEDQSDEPLETAEQLEENRPGVLIAEDNPDMRRLLASVLGREFETRLAKNGREAYEMALEQAPDLVLSDVMMPEMSGIDLCRVIKGNDELRGTPVVLLTSKAEHEMKIEGLESGADDYVTKPFHPRELMARVRSLVRVRGLQRALAQRNSELEAAMGELVQAEAQLVQSERLSAVGELAAEIAHEVNNPVNFALNASRALSATVGDFSQLCRLIAELDPASSESVEHFERTTKELGIEELNSTFDELTGIISDGLTRTHTLVGDLRDFASPGKRAGQRVRVDVGRGIRSTLQLMKVTLSEANAQVDLEVEPDLPKIQGDPGALNQVFLNLVKNAAEAFPEEGGRIEVRVVSKDDGLGITISDDGLGIPEDIRERIFEPFFTTKEAGSGTGLGLAICRKIVAAHGGSMEVESVTNEGTTFTIQLPSEFEPKEPSDPADV